MLLYYNYFYLVPLLFASIAALYTQTPAPKIDELTAVFTAVGCVMDLPARLTDRPETSREADVLIFVRQRGDAEEDCDRRVPSMFPSTPVVPSGAMTPLRSSYRRFVLRLSRTSTPCNDEMIADLFHCQTMVPVELNSRSAIPSLPCPAPCPSQFATTISPLGNN